MFRTEKPWLEVYERGNVEPESRVFEGSLYDLFRHAAEEHRGRNALSFYGTTFEFGRLQALVEKMAASLAACRGLEGGSGRAHAPELPAVRDLVFRHREARGHRHPDQPHVRGTRDRTHPERLRTQKRSSSTPPCTSG